MMKKPNFIFSVYSIGLLGYLTAATAHSESAAVSAGTGDAAKGKAIFEKRCSLCHSLDRNREGPKLGGVYGRISGTAEDFTYSTALKQAHIQWNNQSLERWLTDPDILVPGNAMSVYVAKPEERRDLIAYLRAGSINTLE
jgi:cytochrome c